MDGPSHMEMVPVHGPSLANSRGSDTPVRIILGCLVFLFVVFVILLGQDS
jgi:hypothetical protein